MMEQHIGKHRPVALMKARLGLRAVYALYLDSKADNGGKHE